MEKVAVIIPTYNERGNVEPLVTVLEKVFAKVPQKWEMHILFVDDSSPDGTGEVVKREMGKFANVHLLTNKEKVGQDGAGLQKIC